MTPAFDKGWRPEAPPLQGRGLGWGLSVEQLRELHKRAAEMRRNPTEPEKRLWRHLSNGQLNGAKFRRQSVTGRFIADFLCPQKALIVEVDGDTHDEAKDRLRDDVLTRRGFRVVRVTNDDVMTNMDGVLALIAGAIATTPARWHSPHPNPSPEGEGLECGQGAEIAGDQPGRERRMSKADFYRDLVRDVENLVVAGETAASAMMLIILQDNDVDGPILKTWVMKKHGSEKALEAWARREADQVRLKAALSKEVASCKERAGPYARLPLIRTEPALYLIRERVEREIGRQMSDHEVWMIEETLSPYLSELKLARKAKMQPQRQLGD